MNAITSDFPRQGRVNKQKSCTGNSPGKVGEVVQGQSTKSVADLGAKLVPVISQPRTLPTELRFLPLEAAGFLLSFLSLNFLLSVLSFLSLSPQSNCDPVYLRDAIQNTVVLYFISSTSHHSSREASCR